MRCRRHRLGRSALRGGAGAAVRHGLCSLGHTGRNKGQSPPSALRDSGGRRRGRALYRYDGGYRQTGQNRHRRRSRRAGLAGVFTRGGRAHNRVALLAPSRRAARRFERERCGPARVRRARHGLGLSRGNSSGQRVALRHRASAGPDVLHRLHLRGCRAGRGSSHGQSGRRRALCRPDRRVRLARLVGCRHLLWRRPHIRRVGAAQSVPAGVVRASAGAVHGLRRSLPSLRFSARRPIAQRRNSCRTVPRVGQVEKTL
jgi:hypothetical protein